MIEIDSVVTFENVEKVYDGSHQAVEDFSLQVSRGELVVLIGPSGCGKTTTLRMVNRLVELTAGQILINGRDNLQMNEVQLRRQMGYVIQEIGLFPHMTVADNISVVPDLEGWKNQKKRSRARELLELVRMEPDKFIDRYPRELSGGQQQRIGVLRALAADPDILLMDEPFGALDPITRSELQDELLDLQEKVRKTIIFVTHDMNEATKLADRIVMMRNGRIVQVDSPKEMMRNPKNEFVSEFIGPKRMMDNPMEVRVKKVSSNDTVQAESELSLTEAFKRMRDKKTDYLALIDGNNAFSGIVSVDDIQEGIEQFGEDAPAEKLASCRTISAEATVLEAVHRLADVDVPALAVLDGEELVGVFTKNGLIELLVEEMWPSTALNVLEED